MVAAYLRAILRAESDAAITYSVLDNFKWWKFHVLIDRIMASIVPIMSTKLAIPYRVIYMLPIHISIHIDKVALVLISASNMLEWGSKIISAVFNICCCYLFSSFLSWGNCMGSCSWPTIVSPNFVTPQPTSTMLNCRGWKNVGWGVTGTQNASGKWACPQRCDLLLAYFCLYVPNISSTWSICMIPSMLVSLMAAISGTFSAKYCKTERKNELSWSTAYTNICWKQMHSTTKRISCAQSRIIRWDIIVVFVYALVDCICININHNFVFHIAILIPKETGWYVVVCILS